MNQTITFSDDDLFEWDEEKNKINIQKHGISFNEAKLIFNDYNAIEIFDAENSTIDEERYIVIGEINTFLVVTMIYTERYNKIRIISARYATSKEKEVYYDNYSRTFG